MEKTPVKKGPDFRPLFVVTERSASSVSESSAAQQKQENPAAVVLSEAESAAAFPPQQERSSRIQIRLQHPPFPLKSPEFPHPHLQSRSHPQLVAVISLMVSSSRIIIYTSSYDGDIPGVTDCRKNLATVRPSGFTVANLFLYEEVTEKKDW